MWWVILFLCLCGCRTEYVPVESVRYDSLFSQQIVKDSVYMRDSVYVKDSGDTIFEYKYKYLYVYKDRVDTLYIERVSEKEIPYPVERPLTWWEKVKMDFGGWVMLAASAAILYVLMRWIVKRTRKE